MPQSPTDGYSTDEVAAFLDAARKSGEAGEPATGLFQRIGYDPERGEKRGALWASIVENDLIDQHHLAAIARVLEKRND
jgi:hypothetical protein